MRVPVWRALPLHREVRPSIFHVGQVEGRRERWGPRLCGQVAGAITVSVARAAGATIPLAEAPAAEVGAEAHVFCANNVSAERALIARECRRGRTRSMGVPPGKTSMFCP